MVWISLNSLHGTNLALTLNSFVFTWIVLDPPHQTEQLTNRSSIHTHLTQWLAGCAEVKQECTIIVHFHNRVQHFSFRWTAVILEYPNIPDRSRCVFGYEQQNVFFYFHWALILKRNVFCLLILWLWQVWVEASSLWHAAVTVRVRLWKYPWCFLSDMKLWLMWQSQYWYIPVQLLSSESPDEKLVEACCCETAHHFGSWPFGPHVVLADPGGNECLLIVLSLSPPGRQPFASARVD